MLIEVFKIIHAVLVMGAAAGVVTLAYSVARYEITEFSKWGVK